MASRVVLCTRTQTPHKDVERFTPGETLYPWEKAMVLITGRKCLGLVILGFWIFRNLLTHKVSERYVDILAFLFEKGENAALIECAIRD
jgi:hypothetical protein